MIERLRTIWYWLIGCGQCRWLREVKQLDVQLKIERRVAWKQSQEREELELEISRLRAELSLERLPNGIDHGYQGGR